MAQYQNLIIIGANKCGTTSMFRYLSDHPRVCGSDRKEVHFFYRDLDFKDVASQHVYLDHFPDRRDSQTVLLEATPNYLDGGRRIAENIRSALVNPLLVVMLRNPVDRLVSYYRSKQGWTDSPVHGLSFSEFTDQALTARASDSDDFGLLEGELNLQIRKGEYCHLLREYLSTFAAEKILVIFFDSFRADPRNSLDEVCNFINLSSDIYDAYDFRVENQSRYHRSTALRTFGSKTNLLLEPVLNRLPPLRRVVRRAYNMANVTARKTHHIDEISVGKLEEHFAPHNRELRDLLLSHKQGIELPEWLTR